MSESSKEAESAVELEQIVQTALSEAQIESLIIAKGYADCVAYMSGEGISGRTWGGYGSALPRLEHFPVRG